MRLFVVAFLTAYQVFADDALKVKKHILPKDCDPKATNSLFSCNEYKEVSTRQKKLSLCEGKEGFLYITYDSAAFKKEASGTYSDQGRYLYIGNTLYCDMKGLVKSCEDTTQVLPLECGEKCTVPIPKSLLSTDKLVIQADCEAEKEPDMVIEVKEEIYATKPVTIPSKGLDIKYTIAPLDSDIDESEPCDLEWLDCAKKYDTLAELRINCKPLNDDDLSKQRASCGYKIIAEVTADIAACASPNTAVRLALNDVANHDALSQFSISTFDLTTSKGLQDCQTALWGNVESLKKVHSTETCGDTSDSDWAGWTPTAAKLSVEDNKVIGRFDNGKEPFFGWGGVIATRKGTANCIIPGLTSVHFNLFLNRLSANAGKTSSVITVSEPIGDSCTNDKKACGPKASPTVNPVGGPALGRETYESKVEELCPVLKIKQDGKDSDHCQRIAKIQTDPKPLRSCPNDQSIYLLNVDGTELNYFDQLTSRSNKSLQKFGAFLTVWDIPNNCTVKTIPYGNKITEYGCQGKTWTLNNHHHTNQSVFSGEVFGYTNYNHVGIKLECPTGQKLPTATDLKGIITSISTTLTPQATPADWTIQGNDKVEGQKVVTENGKRWSYQLRQITGNADACDLDKIDCKSATRLTGLETPNSGLEKHYPWDFECPDLWSQKCAFELELKLTVSGRSDPEDDEDPRLYKCASSPKQVRILWGDAAPLFKWNTYNLASIIFDEASKITQMKYAKSRVTEKVNFDDGTKISSKAACPTSSNPEETLKSPTITAGKRIFKTKPALADHGISIWADDGAIGDSEVTIVLRKTFDGKDTVRKALFGEFSNP